MRTIDYRQEFEGALQHLKKIQDDIANIHNEESKADLSVSDLLHIIEITTNASASEGYTLFKQLQDTLIARRDIKNKKEEAREIKDFMSAFKSATRNTMEKKIKAIDGVRNNQGKKTYSLKVLKHLQPYNDRANARQLRASSKKINSSKNR
ncbi:hypothetical protein AB3N02_21850 [Priestia aryabhattai]|uniref:hypothetical protein n=1 Tax=Priestia aryabhattai TaxID=412384 RepID=UPI0039A31F9F